MASPQPDYEMWAEFRYRIRRYVRSAEAAARASGLAPQQHQLLLAVRGYPGGRTPTIGEIAERLQLRHHTTVELVDRMEEGGLVERRPSATHHEVHIVLTPHGRQALAAVTRRMRPELEVAAVELIETLSHLVAPADGKDARAR